MFLSHKLRPKEDNCQTCKQKKYDHSPANCEWPNARWSLRHGRRGIYIDHRNAKFSQLYDSRTFYGRCRFNVGHDDRQSSLR